MMERNPFRAIRKCALMKGVSPRKCVEIAAIFRPHRNNEALQIFSLTIRHDDKTNFCWCSDMAIDNNERGASIRYHLLNARLSSFRELIFEGYIATIKANL